jgi:hypothetical protein
MTKLLLLSLYVESARNINPYSVLLLVLDHMILRRKKNVYYTFYIIKDNL